METVTASLAKQNFGQVLERAARGPIRIERHSKLVAAMVPPQWLLQHQALDERRSARAAQQLVELQRLANHQKMGIELLCAAGPAQRKRVKDARSEVDRWESAGLCSRDYVQRWRAWLGLSVKDLVQVMCSHADGWGAAMRQNSPFKMPPP